MDDETVDENHVALLSHVESLAEDTAARIARGAHDEAIEVLRHAYVHTGGCDPALLWSDVEWEGAERGEIGVDTGVPGDGWGQASVRTARASVCLLLCASLAGAGFRDEALSAARSAESETEKVWRALLASAETFPEGSEGDAEPSAVEVDTASLVALLQRGHYSSPSAFLLAVASETTIQAKHALALEMEHSGADAAAGEVERRQLEGAILAQHLLTVGHPSRQMADGSLQEWHRRSIGMDIGAPIDVAAQVGEAAPEQAEEPAVTAWELLRILLGPSWREPRPAQEVVIEPAGLPPSSSLRPQGGGAKPRELRSPVMPVDRLSRGAPAQVDMRAELSRAKARGKILRLDPIAPAFMRTSSSACALNGGGGSTGSTSCPATMGATSLSRSASSSTVWGNRSCPPGELYATSVDWGPGGLPRNDRWKATGRVPIGFHMAGATGKTSWALRTGATKRSRGQRLNPFEDWLINVAGDTKPLKQKVLESTTGQQDFYMKMRQESKQFKNFWMKEEAPCAELLAEDRILYCAEGMNLKRQLRRDAAARRRREASAFTESASSDVCSADEDNADGRRAGAAVASLGALSPPPAASRSASAAESPHTQASRSPVGTPRGLVVTDGEASQSSASRPRMGTLPAVGSSRSGTRAAAPPPMAASSPPAPSGGRRAPRQGQYSGLRHRLAESQEWVLGTLERKEAHDVRQSLQVGKVNAAAPKKRLGARQVAA